MSNTERFLGIYTKIHRHLRDRLHLHQNASFSEAIREGRRSIPPVRWRYDDLDRCRELRNTLEHTRGEDYMAEPTERTLRTIEEVAELLINPPTMGKLLQGTVVCLQSTQPIGRAVEVMLERSFSQIPIYEDDRFFGLLTTNTVGRWLGSCVEEEIFSLEETLIADVLDYTEDEDNYQFMSRGEPLYEALRAFDSYEEGGKRLEAILITEHGRESESLLGIITIWDLPKIHQELSI